MGRLKRVGLHYRGGMLKSVSLRFASPREEARLSDREREARVRRMVAARLEEPRRPPREAAPGLVDLDSLPLRRGP